MTASATTGAERIAEAFARARADGRRAALMPYMMGGFPDLATSHAIGRGYVAGGADLIELGVPFSDPLADGPVIHAAATRALDAGVRLAHVLELCAELSPSVAVVLMCYVNPILARGPERFLDLAREAGASGLIIPDLPFAESAEMRARCDERGLALVPLVAPTTPAERMAEIGQGARGFVYAVSVTGTTGERSAVEATLAEIVARAAADAAVPVAVGFGISGPEQAAAAVAAGAQGVIVGSRLVRVAGEAKDPERAVQDAVAELGAALR